MLRVTGRVVRVDERSGSKANQSTGEVRDWVMRTARVLVADQAVVEVTGFGSGGNAFAPQVGQAADYAVELRLRGQEASYSFVSDWAKVQPAAAPAARAS